MLCIKSVHKTWLIDSTPVIWTIEIFSYACKDGYISSLLVSWEIEEKLKYVPTGDWFIDTVVHTYSEILYKHWEKNKVYLYVQNWRNNQLN